jgi:hypothetical protein
MRTIVNRTANESLSKFKMLSAYGGPGSIIHTEHGSVIISCIEEWGFINRIKDYIEESHKLNKDETAHVIERAMAEDIALSNDERLLAELKTIKQLSNIKYLVLIPDIEINDTFNTIAKEKAVLAINSTFLPKGFIDRNNNYKTYKTWYNEWTNEISDFFPPKYTVESKFGPYAIALKQDNILLICEHGHVSDFPWAKYLRWRSENPDDLGKEVNIFGQPDCCNNPVIQIKDTSASASGFDSKWIKCNNKGCAFGKGISLKGLMSTKIKCAGQKPWEASTGNFSYYFGDKNAREQNPPYEKCSGLHMRVTLSTANNLYFSRILSSIYIPPKLFLNSDRLRIMELKDELQNAIAKKEFSRCENINNEIKSLESKVQEEDTVSLTDLQRATRYKHAEFQVLTSKTEEQINITEHLRVKDVTNNLSTEFSRFFRRILRIDTLKVTSGQLDFSRVEPVESESDKHRSKNIFKSARELVQSYPVVENYGEGIFIAFNGDLINNFKTDELRFKDLINRERDEFARNAINIARSQSFPLYLIHTFCHLLMRELEFRCGYPTASLSERLYVSKETETQCMVL